MAEQEVKQQQPVVVVEDQQPLEKEAAAEGEKGVELPPPVPEAEEHVKHDDSKALALTEKPTESAPKKISGESIDRDIALAVVEKEKQMSFIKAWEESEKTKAENKAQKKLSAVAAWENSKKAALEAELRKIEENLEKKKAEYAEHMKNKVAAFHKQAEEKRAIVEAQRGEQFLKAEEMAAKYRATGQTPSKCLGCF